MNSIIRSPHPVGVVVRPVHLYQGTMLGGNGIDITIAIFLRMLLVFIKSRPRAFHILQFLLRRKVARLPVASKGVAPYKSLLLTGTKFINHPRDVLLEDCLLLRVLRHNICLGQGRHIMSGAMAFEFCIRRIPSISNLIAFRRHIIRITIVVELLRHIPGANSSNSLIPILRKAVVAINSHIGEREGLGNLFLLFIVRYRHDLNLCRDGIAIVGSLVTYYISFQLIVAAHWMKSDVGLCLFSRERRIHPPHLPPFRIAILIGYPHAIGQLRRIACRTVYLYGHDTLYRPYRSLGSNRQRCRYGYNYDTLRNHI